MRKNNLFYFFLFILFVQSGETIWAQNKTAAILSTQVICKETDRYVGWPTITRTAQDELIVVFSGDRDAHVCPWGKTEMIRSQDNGQTWSAPVVINNTPLDDRDAGIIQTSQGTWLVSWFTSLAFESNLKWQRHAQKVTPELRKQWLGYWVRRSEDNGKNWGKPIATNSSAPHGPIQLRDGRLLYVGRVWHNDQNRILVEESADDGRSWQILAEIKIPKDEFIKYYWEPHVAELKSGKLVAMIRYQPPGEKNRFLWQSESLDGGKSWSPAHKTAVLGYPPHLLSLSNGWLLVVYGRRHPQFSERACISKDEGKTWDTGNEIILAQAPNSDLGYPASTQLADGTIFTVYYQQEQAGEKTCLMGTHWKLNP